MRQALVILDMDVPEEADHSSVRRAVTQLLTYSNDLERLGIRNVEVSTVRIVGLPADH